MSDRTQEALKVMAREDPELAARLILQGLPAAAARIPGELTYDLEVAELGSWRVAVADGDATVTKGNGDGPVDFRMSTDARGLAELAAGESPLKMLLGGRVRIRGKRRKAMKLGAMGNGGTSLADVIKRGGEVDPDTVYRALEYLIDPEWTRGHRFVIAYELSGEGGGKWYVHVRDGERPRVTTEAPEKGPNATGHMSMDTWRRVVSNELTPNRAMQEQLTWVDGEVYPVVMLGRWIERSQGRDDQELARERTQRERLARRGGVWGSMPNGASAATAGGQGDPGHAAEGKRRSSGELLSYGQLYALWEKQNWKAHELDFSVDREHWLAAPLESQQSTLWSLGSFYIGEERVTADLAPFLLAAPSGEVEIFLATQLVDEARHAAFFDRFGAEVMALESEDLRGRMREVETKVLKAWHDVFDDGLRAVAEEIKARPDDLDLFVRGITTYHMVIEGVLATTGQWSIIKYMSEHGLYPGFVEGFSLVERDEHRHIAFGVRFLKDMLEVDRERYGRVVLDTIEELVPKAAYIFQPPYADDAADWVSYGYRSEELYGHAYRALKRRMGVIGLEIPPASELMPGPIDEPAEPAAARA
jgi:ribonucleoside-diphosphate reductase beta chain